MVKKVFSILFLILIVFVFSSSNAEAVTCYAGCDICYSGACWGASECPGICNYTTSGCVTYGSCVANPPPCVCPTCRPSSGGGCSVTTPCQSYVWGYYCNSSTCPGCYSTSASYYANDSCTGLCPSGQCSGGVCVPPCTNECSSSGEIQCIDGNNYYSVCGNYDADSCLEWGGATTCGSGKICSGGSCVASCTSECSSGSILCIDPEHYKSCGNYDADSCLEWSTTLTACPGGEYCDFDDNICSPLAIVYNFGSCTWNGPVGEGGYCPAFGIDSTGNYCCYNGGYPIDAAGWCRPFNAASSSIDIICSDSCLSYDVKKEVDGSKTCTSYGWECNSIEVNCDDSWENEGEPYPCCDDYGRPCLCQDMRKMDGYCNPATGDCTERATDEIFVFEYGCGDPCNSLDGCGGLPHHYKDYSCNEETGACDYETYCSYGCEAECISSWQSIVCENCGYKSCIEASCTWGSCEDQKECTPTMVQEIDNCGVLTCNSECFWEETNPPGECSSGETEFCGSSGCGVKTCSDECEWGPCYGTPLGTVSCCADNKSQVYQADCNWSSCYCSPGSCGAECSSSANCDDGDIHTLDVCESNCICSHTDINEPPEKPLPPIPPSAGSGEGEDPSLYPLGESWQHCLFANLSLPTFHWTYSDPDGDPQQAYQLRIDDNSGFPAAIQPDEFYKEALSSSHAFVPTPSEWRDWVDWSKSYWWIVRVQDDHGKWSEWSDPNRFNTPTHAYPYPDFAFTPADPVQGEAVSFNPDDSESYGGTTISNYLWDITQGSGTFASSTESSQYPEIIFTAFDNAVALEITDSDGYSCQSDSKSVITEIPLPEYHESSPSAWIKNIFGEFNRILSVFSFKY